MSEMPPHQHCPERGGQRWYLVTLIMLWTLIYLPGLGTPEFKGEEPRRVQPALAMMGSGEWIVPHIGGEPYLNKPPLINWLVATAFFIGGQSEFSARMVSTLAVLAMMLGIFLFSNQWLGSERAFLAALFATTHVSIIDKGRLIEIEALYIALFSLALVVWFRMFLTPCHGNLLWREWSLWSVPWFFLGLGILVKGPIHLLFFYALVISMITLHNRWRTFFSWAHLGGALLGVSIFLAWTLALFQRIQGEVALKTWRGQMGSRLAGEPDRLISYEFLLNLPKILINFLPWTLLVFAVLLLQRRNVHQTNPGGDRDGLELTARALALGALPLFIILAFIPGILPRYTMPLFTPTAIWLACVLPPFGNPVIRLWEITNRTLGGIVALATAAAFFLTTSSIGWLFCFLAGCCCYFAFKKPRGEMDGAICAARTAAVIAGGVLIYAGAVAPRLEAYDDVRPVAREILARTKNDASICLVDPDSRPFIAYLPPSVRFARRFSEVPGGTSHVILKASALSMLKVQDREKLIDIWEFKDRGREPFVLCTLKNVLPPSPLN